MEIALVAYPGVLGDECGAFRTVLERLPGATFVVVGAATGEVAGPGGPVTVDRRFDDVDHPDILIVPGGLGCRRIAADGPLRSWLGAVAPTCRWVVASSTGSVVLAAAGLLHGERAVTHWLASDLLREHGAERAPQRLLVNGNVVTCEGRVSALDAAFTIVAQIGGDTLVETIRSQLLEHARVDMCPRRWFRRRGAARRPAEGHEAPPSRVLIELVATADDGRQRRRRAHRG